MIDVRALRSAPLPRPMLAALAALALAAGVGAAMPLVGTSFVVLGLAAVGLVVTARWPALWLLTVVALTSSIFQYGELPRLGTAGLSLYAPELLLLVLVGWAVLRMARNPLAGGSAVLPGVLVLGLLVATATAVLVGATTRGGPIQEEVTAARYMAFYALYFPARAILGTREGYRAVLFGLLALAGVAAIVYDLVVLTPARDVLIANAWFGATIQQLIVNQRLDAIDAGRVYMPARALIQMMVFPALILAVALPPGTALKRAAVGLTALFMLSVVLIFTRAVWLTTLMAVLLLVPLTFGQLRLSLVKMIGIGLAIGFALAVVSAVFDTGSDLSPVDIVWNRFASIIVDNINDENFAYRIREAQLILQRVEQNWLIGPGFRTPILEQWAYDASSGQYAYANIFAYHNGFLTLLLGTGVLGLVPFLGLSAVGLFFVCRRRWGSHMDPLLLAGGLGFGVSLVRVLLNGLTESTFNDSFTVPLLVISLAFVERAVISLRSTTGRTEHHH